MPPPPDLLNLKLTAFRLHVPLTAALKRAGVARSTWSRAYYNGADMRQSTRDDIRAAIDSLARERGAAERQPPAAQET